MINRLIGRPLISRNRQRPATFDFRTNIFICENVFRTCLCIILIDIIQQGGRKNGQFKKKLLMSKNGTRFWRNQGKVFFYDLHIFPKQSASAACWNDSHKKVQFKQKKNLRWRRVHQWPQCCHKFATSPWDFFIPNSWKTIFKNHM